MASRRQPLATVGFIGRLWIEIGAQGNRVKRHLDVKNNSRCLLTKTRVSLYLKFRLVLAQAIGEDVVRLSKCGGLAIRGIVKVSRNGLYVVVIINSRPRALLGTTRR